MITTNAVQSLPSIQPLLGVLSKKDFVVKLIPIPKGPELQSEGNVNREVFGMERILRHMGQLNQLKSWPKEELEMMLNFL